MPIKTAEMQQSKDINGTHISEQKWYFYFNVDFNFWNATINRVTGFLIAHGKVIMSNGCDSNYKVTPVQQKEK